MRVLILTVVALAIVGGGVIYSAYISFSEHREYSRGSFDFYLLTPRELSAISEFCKDEPVFIYSAADGPKPVIATLNCEIDTQELDDYRKSEGILIDGSGVDESRRFEMQVTTTPTGEKVTSIVLIQWAWQVNE